VGDKQTGFGEGLKDLGQKLRRDVVCLGDVLGGLGGVRAIAGGGSEGLLLGEILQRHQSVVRFFGEPEHGFRAVCRLQERGFRHFQFTAVMDAKQDRTGRRWACDVRRIIVRMGKEEQSGAVVRVRPMELGDVRAVTELVGQLSYQRTAEDVAAWIAGVQPEIQAAFVACVADEVVGWVEVSMERRLQYAPFALIGGLVVREGMRSLGIGRRLCEEAERWCVDRGAANVRVTSRSTREAAHRFYLRDGYELVKMSMVFEKQVGG